MKYCPSHISGTGYIVSEAAHAIGGNLQRRSRTYCDMEVKSV